MMYKLIFAPAFTEDLDNTFEYVSQTLLAPGAAKNLMKRIDDAIINLKEFPEMYPLCDEPLYSMGYRKIAVGNHIIIYYIDNDNRHVNLLRCFYGKNDYVKYFT